MSECEKNGCRDLSGYYTPLFGVVGAVVCDYCRVRIDRDPGIIHAARAEQSAVVLAQVAISQGDKDNACKFNEWHDARVEDLRAVILSWLAEDDKDKPLALVWLPRRFERLFGMVGTRLLRELGADSLTPEDETRKLEEFRSVVLGANRNAS